MTKRPYYSARHRGGSGRAGFDLPTLRKLFLAVYESASSSGLFYQAFGYSANKVQYRGMLGADIGSAIHLALRKDYLWPITATSVSKFSEEDIFDLIEFLFDQASEPRRGGDLMTYLFNPHGRQDGPDFYFDKEAGQKKLRAMYGDILKDYDSGWQLTEAGQVVRLAEAGLESLAEARLPEYDPDNVEKRVEAAIRKYRNRGSSVEDRLDAIRDLAGVLEFLRPKAEEYFLTKKDDGDLFAIANGFAIRHHNGRQKGDYNIAIWYSWIFYVYLATIHASVRAIQEGEASGPFS